MIALTDENFEKEISKSEKLVLVDFFGIWCTPCLILSPILEKLEKDYDGKVIFAKVNVDESPKTCQKFGINPIPTVILFKEGKPVKGFFGVRPEEMIRDWLKENLLIREYEEYAKNNSLKLNPNKEAVARLVKSLLEREKKFGKRYCVCRRITGNLEEDEKIVCPCVYAPKEIEEQGHCLCGLFWRK